MELVKQAGWSADPPALYHFRTHEGDEVDLVLERRGGALVGIEVKSTATVTAADFKGLRALAQIAGRRFRRGIVWRERGQEACFVVRAGRTLTAIEVKSGRTRDARAGLAAFGAAFGCKRQLLVGGDGIAVEDFLSRPVEHWVRPG